MKIAIIGGPCTGKTELSKRLAKALAYKLFHADDFLYGGPVDSMYLLLNAVQQAKTQNFICEGTQVNRLLRKGAMTNSLYFDAIIECQASESVRSERYKARGETGSVIAMDAGLKTVLDEYLAMVKGTKREPKFIKFDSERDTLIIDGKDMAPSILAPLV